MRRHLYFAFTLTVLVFLCPVRFVSAQEKGKVTAKAAIKLVNRTQVVFTDKDKVVVEVRIKNRTGAKIKGTIAYTIKDYYGDTNIEKKKSVGVDAGAEYPLKLKLKLKKFGVYYATLKYTTAAEEVVKTAFRFAIVPAPKHPTGLIDESPFGMGIYIDRHREYAGRVVELAQTAGVKISRHEFSWIWMEMEKGKFAFGDGKMIDNARAHGVGILGMLAYGTTWANPIVNGRPDPQLMQPPAKMEDFGNFTYNIAKFYKGRITHWEIWNEPNSRTFWRPRPNPKAYAALLKAAWEGAKKADPDNKVLGCSTYRVDMRFIEGVFKAGGGDYMDIVAVHPYRYPLEPEARFMGLPAQVEEYRRLDRLIKKYGGKQKIWLTEVGWPTNTGMRGVNEKVQADMVVRLHVLALTVPSVEKILWYAFRNFGTSKRYNEHNFGLLLHNLQPKPSYVAYSVMTWHLDGLTMQRTLLFGKKVHAVAFAAPAKNGKPGAKNNVETLVMWTTDRAGKTVRLRADGRSLTIVDIMGNTYKVKIKKGVAELKLTPSPIYILNVPGAKSP